MWSVTRLRSLCSRLFSTRLRRCSTGSRPTPPSGWPGAATRPTTTPTPPRPYPARAGAALGGRSMDQVMFNGRLLGAHFCHLRDPLPEFMVLGGMMVTMADAQHLLSVTKSFQSWRAGMKLVLRPAADRLRGYHRGTGLVLGNALAARLFKSLIERRVPYWLNAPLEPIHVAAGSAPGVTGVTVLRAGKPVRGRARRAA